MMPITKKIVAALIVSAVLSMPVSAYTETPALQYSDSAGNTVADSWTMRDGKMVYVKSNGKLAKNGFYEINNEAYYFDEKGNVVTGRFLSDDTEYYADKSGRLYSNEWVWEIDTWFYALEDGSIMKSGMTPDGYEVDKNGHLIKKEFEEPDEAKLYTTEPFTYHTDGRARTLMLKTGASSAIWLFLKADGWTDTAIAGVLGNFQHESGMDPNALQSDGSGYGLGQWTGGRRRKLINWANEQGLDPTSMEAQLNYLLVEPNWNEYVNEYKVTEFSSPEEACIKWMRNWEKPDESEAALYEIRIPYANAYYEYFTSGAGKTAVK